MASVMVSGYMSGVLAVDFVSDIGLFTFGFSARYVGLSILKGGKVFDFPPVNIGGRNSGTVAFAVKQELLEGSEVIAALWNNYPSPSTAGLMRITDCRVNGNNVLAIATTNPIANIGQSVVQTVEGVAQTAGSAATMLGQLGQFLPFILIGFVLFEADKTGGKFL